MNQFDWETLANGGFDEHGLRKWQEEAIKSGRFTDFKECLNYLEAVQNSPIVRLHKDLKCFWEFLRWDLLEVSWRIFRVTFRLLPRSLKLRLSLEVVLNPRTSGVFAATRVRRFLLGLYAHIVGLTALLEKEGAHPPESERESAIYLSSGGWITIKLAFCEEDRSGFKLEFCILDLLFGECQETRVPKEEVSDWMELPEGLYPVHLQFEEIQLRRPRIPWVRRLPRWVIVANTPIPVNGRGIYDGIQTFEYSCTYPEEAIRAFQDKIERIRGELRCTHG